MSIKFFFSTNCYQVSLPASATGVGAFAWPRSWAWSRSSWSSSSWSTPRGGCQTGPRPWRRPNPGRRMSRSWPTTRASYWRQWDSPASHLASVSKSLWRLFNIVIKNDSRLISNCFKNYFHTLQYVKNIGDKIQSIYDMFFHNWSIQVYVLKLAKLLLNF